MSYKLKMVELGSLYSAIAFSPSDLPFVQPMLRVKYVCSISRNNIEPI